MAIKVQAVFEVQTAYRFIASGRLLIFKLPTWFLTRRVVLTGLEPQLIPTGRSGFPKVPQVIIGIG